jgi:lysophospholipase L1-like esterase
VRKRAMGLVGAALFALVAAGCGLITAPHAQSVQWLVYGDSLSEQSAPYLAQSGTVGSRYFGGTAPCNWVAGLSNDRASFTPTKVLVQFIGNLPPACMTGRDPKTAYEQDLTKIVSFWKAQNVPVVMIISPPTETDSLAWARQAEQDVAANLNIPINSAGQAVLTDTGQFTFFLPCQASETPALGCGLEQPGAIRVRNADGVHFGTAGYSSGAERFANAESHS